MIDLNRMTIKTRMILSFILMGVLFLIFGLIALQQMNRLGRLTAILYEHPLRVSNAALKAKAGVIGIHSHMKDISASKTQFTINLAIHRIQEGERQVYEELDIIQERILGEEGKQLIKETIQMFAGWKSIRVEVEAKVLAGDRDGANRITREKGAEYVARLERQMSALAAYAINKADGFMADARDTESEIVANAVLFIGAMILTGLVIGFFMASSIISSISALKETMSEITQTGKLRNAQIKGRNEISEMADHFNGLILRLKRQFWMEEGRNNLTSVLTGELGVADLQDISLRTVCRHTQACAGALYRFTPDTGTCELKSSFAIVERPHLANRFELGQGIVGQVAAEKKPIFLTHIRPDEALGQSGTVSAPPSAIYALPLFHEEVLYGVLEVAAFTPMDDVSREYLEAAAGTIAIFLHNAAQNERIKHLLAVSQEANERLQVQTHELQAQTEELQALNEEFQQQSHELQSQNLALEDQRVHVEEANRLKSEFLSNMSHELRTPLNSVNALSRVLLVQAKKKLSQEELEYLTIIERNGKHLLSLINDILDLSKIEAGRMEVNVTRFSLNNTVATILDSVGPMAREKGVKLSWQCGMDLPDILSDEARVYQVIQNIVANAVKFTREGSVTVSAEINRPGTVSVTVTDTGIGISDKDLAGIFEEFRQVDGASTRRFEGTGLGLSIAYKSARLLGGDIEVDSRPGKGSTFTITLPVSYQEGEQGKTALGDYRRTIPPATPPADHSTFGAGPGSGKNPTILVVDDDPEIQAIMSTELTNAGYICLTVGTGAAALKTAREKKPDAITLDILMPDMDGWEVLAELKKDQATRDIPVIIVSVSRDDATGYALGAVGYMTKPIRQETLIEEIRKLFSRLPSKILVVDDNPIDRQRLSSILASNDMSFQVAENGYECLDIIRKQMPDLLILDLVMPEMDGFEILATLRSEPAWAHLPVIIVTAKDLSQEERQLLDAQVAAVVTKGSPSESLLITRIKSILANTRSLPQPPPQTVEDSILLVEDNEAIVIQVRKVLVDNGYKVDVAKNGREALAHIRRPIPQGIILDLMMPDVDGFQVLESIRATEETRHIPV
ncbi:MAG TPA: hypothetical protein DHV36_17660, partial [Desulfobacteraceae bacterium]|nr:hypothetical protein [Desulfobacteraceae bacterium]